MKKIGLKRDVIDKYYTKIATAKQCVEIVKQNINILETDIIIEPSAGSGSFIKAIKEIKCNNNFYDIKPENKEIIEQDFLELNLSKFKYNQIHFIGNPPFGRQSSLAIKFIKKCCTVNSTISFILPKSFKKDSMKKHFPENFHLIYEYDFEDISFDVGDKEIKVPCIFQIWVWKNEKRECPHKQIPNNYAFVKKDDNPDISFRRVGVYAGNISQNIDDKSIQSHYFIKFEKSVNIKDYLEKLKKIHFDFNNSVGAKSISKPELIKEFNRVLS